jgi:tRNA (Thr-GGU) A37 N-methylase
MVRIDKIDALNGSPIVDIKPYVPTIDSTTENVQTPQWLSS